MNLLNFSTKLIKPESNSKEDMDSYPCPKLVGSLMYLTVGTSPDIVFVVNFLSQFNTCYTRENWIAGKRVLGYLWGTLNSRITFLKCDRSIQGYVSAIVPKELID